MAVLLNELFFPKYDPHTASLLAAFALCSSLAFRPIGALIFGWIGDNIGRKPTIIITTVMMAASCLVMANLPTYAQIGISAAWILTICRIVQGISSMGEAVGAEIYLTESIERPARYPAVALVDVSSASGDLFALGVAYFVTSSGLNWRIVFWLGASIAIVSAFARTRLRETPAFLEMKRKELKKDIEEINLELDPVRGEVLNKYWKERINKKTVASYFFIACGWPLCMYTAYFYFNPILKESFGYSTEDIIKHNFFLALIAVISNIFVAYLSYHTHPLKINKIRAILILPLMLSLPFLTMNLTSPVQLFLIQAFILTFPLRDMPAASIFIEHLPFYLRFTFASFLFAIARALIYITTSFGLIYLGSYFGHFGLCVITLPTTLAFLYGIFHFQGLERELDLVHKRISESKPI